MKNIALSVLLFVFTKGVCQESETSGYENFKETIWLTTERNLYISGEIIRFNVSVLEQDTYKESSLSKNIRVELLDPYSNPISQQNLVLERSSVSGNLLLPSEAKSGWYYIRAYTNWMRNSHPDVFATRAVKVLDPTESNDLNTFSSRGLIGARLYPHGDEAGLFIGYDEFTGIRATGWILDVNEDTLCKFESHPSGWASIKHRIEYEKSYILSLEEFDTGEYITQLEVIESGSINIDLQKSGRNLVMNVVDRKASNPSLIKLIVHQSYTTYWESEPTDISEANFILPLSMLPGGIVQFSVVDDDNNILGKRLWSDHSMTSLTINGPDGPDKLSIRTDYTANFLMPVEVDKLVVKVARVEPGAGTEVYLPGLPGWYCTSQIPADDEAFRGWLLANSYPENILYQILNPVQRGQEENILKHLPETRAGILEGKVIDTKTSLGAPGIGVSITVLENNRFDATTSDQNGFFCFSLDGLEGNTDYILNFTTSIDPDLELYVIPEFEPRKTSFRSRFYLSKEELDYLNQVNTKIQLNSIYDRIPEYVEPLASSGKTRQTFFHPPDHVTVLDDYIKLANIREIIYELVPNVGVRNQNGKSVIKVQSENHFLKNAETLVLLDEIPLADQTELLQLPTSRIDRIEVKSKLYIFGSNVYSAIVNFVSPNKDYAGLDLPGNSILSSYNLPFRSIPNDIMDENIPLNIPVLNETLYSRYTETGNKNRIEFKTNDLTGSFQILVYGFDTNGNWISGIKNFTIVN